MRSDYIARMNAFRGRQPQVAAVLVARPAAKPKAALKAKPGRISTDTSKKVALPMPLLAVDRSYPRWKALEADLIRHYEACSVSKSAKRFEGARKKAYCAGTAWKIVRESGRYTDYPAFQKKETAAMATGKGKGKKKPKASKTKTKAPKKSAARVAAAKKAAKTREAKHVARSKAAKKAARTRKKNEAKAAAPKRSTKSPKKAAARTASKKPKKKRAGKKKVESWKRKARAKTKSTKKSAARSTAPRRGGTKKSAGRRPKKKVNVNIPGIRVVGGKPQTTNVRLTISREALAAKRGGRKGKRPKRPSAREGMAVHEGVGAMVMENPMSGSEFAVAGIAVGVGVFLSDLTTRWVMTRGAAKAYANQGKGDSSDGSPATASTKGSWLGYGDAVSAPPNLWAMAAQAGLVGASVAGAWFFDNRYVRAGFQGVALGAIGNVVKTLVVDFVLVKWFGVDKKSGSPRPMVQRLYPLELNASFVAPNLLPAASSSTGTAGVPENAGAPTGVGRPNARPYGTRFFKDVGPHASPAGVGNTDVPRGGDQPKPTPPARGGDQPPVSTTPPTAPPALDVGTPPMGGCAPPCSTTSYGQQALEAYDDGVKDANCGCEGTGRVPEPVPVAPPTPRPAVRTQPAVTGLGKLGLPTGIPLFATTDAAAE